MTDFFYFVDLRMDFGIETVGGKIGGDGVDFTLYASDFLFEFRLHRIQLLGQHLVSFHNKIQFVMEVFGLNSKLMAEFFFDFFLEKDQLFFEMT